MSNNPEKYTLFHKKTFRCHVMVQISVAQYLVFLASCMKSIDSVVYVCSKYQRNKLKLKRNVFEAYFCYTHFGHLHEKCVNYLIIKSSII